MTGTLERATWLANGALAIDYRYPSGGKGRRVETADHGAVTLLEAAQVIGIKPLRLYRLRRTGGLLTVTRRGRTMIPVKELRRLRHLFKD